MERSFAGLQHGAVSSVFDQAQRPKYGRRKAHERVMVLSLFLAGFVPNIAKAQVCLNPSKHSNKCAHVQDASQDKVLEANVH